MVEVIDPKDGDSVKALKRLMNQRESEIAAENRLIQAIKPPFTPTISHEDATDLLWIWANRKMGFNEEEIRKLKKTDEEARTKRLSDEKRHKQELDDLKDKLRLTQLKENYPTIAQYLDIHHQTTLPKPPKAKIEFLKPEGRIEYVCGICGKPGKVDFLTKDPKLNDCPLQKIKEHGGLVYSIICDHRDTKLDPKKTGKYLMAEEYSIIIFLDKIAMERHALNPKDPVRLSGSCPQALIDEEISSSGIRIRNPRMP